MVVNGPVAIPSWYPTVTCGSSKLVLPSGHTPRNRHDWQAKPGKGLRCCVYLHTRRDKQDVQVIKAIRGADGWKDHRLVISKMSLRLQPRRTPQGKRTQGKLNTVLLNMHAQT
ncbi:unnamed protein product [Schistocephalus solidus]|uniref:Transposase n=1 Tax=Schistocephalus solidus TaxID=70667 RepID=A0A183SUM4_SCHSO|nr:unnamed protein product [Schistocephalus solidus]